MLKAPETIVGADFKQHRLAALDQQVMAEYEKVVTEWMVIIETVLIDTADERWVSSS